MNTFATLMQKKVIILLFFIIPFTIGIAQGIYVESDGPSDSETISKSKSFSKPQNHQEESSNFSIDTGSVLFIEEGTDESDPEKTLEDLEKDLKEINKPKLVYLGATWCVPCKVMRKTVFVDDKIRNYLDKNYAVTYVDIDRFTGMDIKEKFNVQSVPEMLFFDKTGKICSRLSGSVNVKALYELLKLYNE